MSYNVFYHLLKACARNIQSKLQYVQLSLSTRHKGYIYLYEESIQEMQKYKPNLTRGFLQNYKQLKKFVCDFLIYQQIFTRLTNPLHIDGTKTSVIIFKLDNTLK